MLCRREQTIKFSLTEVDGEKVQAGYLKAYQFQASFAPCCGFPAPLLLGFDMGVPAA